MNSSISACSFQAHRIHSGHHNRTRGVLIMRQPLKTALFAGLAFGVAGIASVSGARVASAAAPAISASSTNLLQSPQITAALVAMAYAKMTGTSPDLEQLAKSSVEYERASTFDQPSVLQHLTASLTKEFNNLSPSSIYTVNITAWLMQYNPQAGGWPTDFTDDKFLPFQNPVGGPPLQLSFDNVGQFNALPVPPADARSFAEQHQFNTHSSIAEFAILRLAFRIVGAPPSVSASFAPVTAHILQGEILTDQGQRLYVFPPAADATQRQNPKSFASNSIPNLPSSTLDGVSLGMPQDKAEIALAVAFPKATFKHGPGFAAFYDHLQAGAQPSTRFPS